MTENEPRIDKTTYEYTDPREVSVTVTSYVMSIVTLFVDWNEFKKWGGWYSDEEVDEYLITEFLHSGRDRREIMDKIIVKAREDGRVYYGDSDMDAEFV